MQSHAVDHDVNVIGAAVLLVADRVRDAVEPETGTTGASAAGLTALLAWANGAHIDALAGGLRLSHSRTVRLVDGLERDGLAVRRPDRIDGRRALIHLTKRGRATAERVLAARADALREVLAPLTPHQQEAVAAAASVLLQDAAVSRAEARAICRLCDVVACGHREGACPSTRGADLHELGEVGDDDLGAVGE